MNRVTLEPDQTPYLADALPGGVIVRDQGDNAHRTLSMGRLPVHTTFLNHCYSETFVTVTVEGHGRRNMF